MNVRHLARYKDIAKLLWKYGRSDLVRQMAVDEDLAGEGAGEPGDTPPEQLADDLEAMGPTFVKLGQVLSSRPDLLPAAYLKALTRLQDKVKPFPYAEAEQIVEAELGVRISRAFSRFDAQPIAAASLGQVHAAALRDGREVVVKVQRPDAARQVAQDLEVLGEMARLLDKHTEVGRRHRLSATLEELRLSISHELNYEREARHLTILGKNLAGFERIQVPQPVSDYSSRRVLTMEYVRGLKITSLSPVARLELDGAALAEELFKAYLKQVLVDGLFHADPHPGNVFITQDHRIALLDLGMVGHISPGMQERLIRLLIAVSEGHSDEAGTIAISISEQTDRFDEVEFRRHLGALINEQKDSALAEIEVGSVILQVSRSAAETGLFVPSDLSLLGKTLLQLDQVGRTLDPAFNPNDAIRRNVTEILNQRMSKSFTSGKILSSMLELKDFVGGLPPKVNKILDALGDPRLEVFIRPRDKHQFLAGLNHSANRITAGLILAALIVGAALLMRVPTEFQLFGYPGLAIICFLMAVTGGVILLLNIILQDRKHKKRARELWP